MGRKKPRSEPGRPHRRNREIVQPIRRLEVTLRQRRRAVLNRHARFTEGKMQFCPTHNLRGKPKIIFDTEEAASEAQRGLARVGFDDTHPYRCVFNGDVHWHLGREDKWGRHPHTDESVTE